MYEPRVCRSPNADISTGHAAEHILRVRRERGCRYHTIGRSCVFSTAGSYRILADHLAIIGINKDELLGSP